MSIRIDTCVFYLFERLLQTALSETVILPSSVDVFEAYLYFNGVCRRAAEQFSLTSFADVTEAYL